MMNPNYLIKRSYLGCADDKKSVQKPKYILSLFSGCLSYYETDNINREIK